MKYRSGFVSNSSSCSFCIYGSMIELSEFRKRIKDFLKRTELITDDMEIEQYISRCVYDEEEIIGTDGLSLFYKDLDFNIYIGRSWSSINDKETGESFKNSIELDIKEIFGGTKNFNTHTEAWYDG